MPTRSNPDSPFIDSQVQAALGGRPPGTPTTAGKPIAQPADFSVPAPPSPATAPAGRPPAPAIPAPLAPAVPPPTVATPLAAGPGAPPAGEDEEGEDGGAGLLAGPTPEDTQRYREAVVQLRTRLGPVPRIFRNPGLPEMPAEPGLPNYNPWTGLWDLP